MATENAHNSKRCTSTVMGPVIMKLLRIMCVAVAKWHERDHFLVRCCDIRCTVITRRRDHTTCINYVASIRWSKVVGRAREPLVSISIHRSIDRASQVGRVCFRANKFLVARHVSHANRKYQIIIECTIQRSPNRFLVRLKWRSHIWCTSPLHRSFLFRRLSARRFRRLKIDFPLASLLYGLSIYTYNAHVTHSWQHCINF